MSDMDVSGRVASEIRSILGRQDLSKAELARRLGVSHTWVTNRLTGAQEISLNELDRIAVALGVEFADLLPRSLREAVTQGYSRPAERWTGPTRPRRKSGRPSRNRPVEKTSRPPNVSDGSRRPVLLPRHL